MNSQRSSKSQITENKPLKYIEDYVRTMYKYSKHNCKLLMIKSITSYKNEIIFIRITSPPQKSWKNNSTKKQNNQKYNSIDSETTYNSSKITPTTNKNYLISVLAKLSPILLVSDKCFLLKQKRITMKTIFGQLKLKSTQKGVECFKQKIKN